MTAIFVAAPRHLVQTTKKSQEQPTPYLRLANCVFAIVLLIGVLCILLRLWGAMQVLERESVWVSSLATCFMWVLACPALGGPGFLFRIPQILPADAPSTVQPRYESLINTKEISAWLTRLFVVFGMIYLIQAFDTAIRLAHAMARAVNPTSPQTAFAFSLALIIFILIAGFIYSYLLTRKFLRSVLVRADRQALPSNGEQTSLRGVCEADADEERFGSVSITTPCAEDIPCCAPTAAELLAVSRIAPNSADTDLSTVRRQAQELGKYYEMTRMVMSPSDPQRPTCLNRVVQDMQKLAPAVSPLLATLTASESLGERLVAIISLQIRPDPQYIPWLGERIALDASSLRYHAALALLSVAQAYGSDSVQKTILRHTLIDALASFEDHIGGPNKARRTDTYAILDQALDLTRSKSCL